MEHLEGYNARMFNQADLPDVGSFVPVEAWRTRGYVERLRLTLQATWPSIGFAFANHGKGGATSRDILQIIETTVEGDIHRSDVTFYGCGINDVWRRFQGRTAEAVDAEEFDNSYRGALHLLSASSRRVVCIAETPFGWDNELDVAVLNDELQQYNALAAAAAADAGADFIDVWPAFTTAATQLAGWSDRNRPVDTLWSDGVHLSDLGDALMHDLVHNHLTQTSTIADLTTSEALDRDVARETYADLIGHARPTNGT